MQEEIGFSVVVDGEFRRENWWIDFVAQLRGVEIRDGDAAQAFVAPRDADAGHGDDHDHGWKYVSKNVVTPAKVRADGPITAADFAFLKSATSRAANSKVPTT